MSSPVSADRRSIRRQQQQELSRAHLLDAAEDVFGRRGFALATLKEIAELAGFAVGSVYLFFPSKEELFRAVYLRRGQEFMPGMAAAVSADTEPGDALVRLHRLVDFQVGFFRARPAFGRLYLRFSGTADSTQGVTSDPTVMLRFEESMRMQAELVAEGQAAGLLRSGDPAVLSRLFSGLIQAYQASDPTIMAETAQATSGEPLPLSALHEMVEAAFRR